MVWPMSTTFSTAFFACMLINFSFQQVSQQLFTHVDQFFSLAGFSTALRTCWSILLSNKFLNSFADMSVNFSFLLVPLKLQASSYSRSYACWLHPSTISPQFPQSCTLVLLHNSPQQQQQKSFPSSSPP